MWSRESHGVTNGLTSALSVRTGLVRHAPEQKLAKQGQDLLSRLVSLGERTGAGLIEDLVLGEVHDLIRDIGILNLAEGSGEVLHLDAQGIGNRRDGGEAGRGREPDRCGKYELSKYACSKRI